MPESANRQDASVSEEAGNALLGKKSLPSAERVLVQRVVASPAFTRSVHLIRFLLYICECKLGGREDKITEYRIGVHALGRSGSYNPGDDNIVRSYARILRKRLEEYFSGEGSDEPLRIVVPVGRYVPVFEPNLISNPVPNPVPSEHFGEPASTPGSQEVVPDSRQTPAGRGSALQPRWRRIALAAAVVLVACVGLAGYMEKAAQASPLYHAFWKEIFNRSRVSYLVPGDSGLAMMQEITGKEVDLSEYIAGDLDEKFHDFNLAAARGGAEYSFDRVSNFTSKADLSIAAGVAGLAQLHGGQLQVCYPRSMNMENFRDSNVILVGGPRANPWMELFEPESNFRILFPMHADGIHFDERNLINKHPQAGEQATYTNQTTGSSTRAYALISFLPELDGSGHALLLQGLGMAGTQAAGDFLLDPHQMEPILKKARNADGNIGPFEVLIEARTVGTNAAQPRVVAERFGVTKNSR